MQLEVPTELEVAPVDDPRDRHVAGSIVRGVVLVVLIVVIAPAIVRGGDVLAFPGVALPLLVALVVAVVSLTYWLATVGAPADWLARNLRLTPDRFVIATASAFGIASAIGLMWFRNGINDPRSSLAQFDLRAASAAARLVGEASLMDNLNSLGIRSMLVLGGMLVVAAIVSGAFRGAVLLALTMAAGGLLVEFLKLNPPRPLAALGLPGGSQSSWPSGHAAFQSSIALGFVMLWWAAGLPRPSIVAALVLPLASLVGYSRAFLGIHWLSEVLSGWLVAVVAASFVLVLDRLLTPRLPALPRPKPWLVSVALIVALVVTWFAVQSVQRFHDHGPRDFRDRGARDVPDPFRFRGASSLPADASRLASAEPAAVLGSLPHFSETLLGRRAQPLGLVVIASEDRLHAAVEQAGWKQASIMTPKRLIPDFFAGLTGGADRNEPVAVTFYDTRQPDVVLWRPASDHGAATHRAQVWELPMETPNGCPVWAVTTSGGEGGRFSWRGLFPLGHDAPTIDSERDALTSGLAASGSFDALGRFDFEGAMRGHGPGGKYSTDGKVAVLRQPGC